MIFLIVNFIIKFIGIVFGLFSLMIIIDATFYHFRVKKLRRKNDD